MLNASRKEDSTHIEVSIPQKTNISTAILLSQTSISVLRNAESLLFIITWSVLSSGVKSSIISASHVSLTQIGFFFILSSLDLGRSYEYVSRGQSQTDHE
jgi:hypothetical protein